ncbi:MAG: hypothetical protein LUG90_12500 [Clostridiaceae bacterium]|nr:hypothetical protein [Clostridiaceae bacterium]
MKYKEFLEYLESNLDGYKTFMNKAMSYQKGKNVKRPPKSRWSDEKVEKAAYEMWKKSMEALYNNLKKEIKSDLSFPWTSYMEKHEIFETVNESISELDFNGEVA